MVTRQMGLDDGVAFGVKGNSADRRPVTRVTRPARRVALACLEIQVMPGSQDRVIVACVALSGADVTNSAVTVVEVIPAHEIGGPRAGLFEVHKALSRKLRSILGGTGSNIVMGCFTQ